jgi:predicted P-loop ATPase
MITVLESPEGWNKSSFWRLLAMSDENFSDASILGKNSREVQEHLAEVWIHENSELAGLGTAEVEMIKSFASRQSDNARPAWGHFLKKQPRHSIEGGSTNSEEYLPSQTGNRRFGTLKVLAPIDLELIKRDRLQLWGEAATYEAQGESLVIDEALWPAAAEAQEKRRKKDVWEDILADMPTHWDLTSYDKVRLISADQFQKALDHYQAEVKAKKPHAALATDPRKSCYPIIHIDGDKEVVASAVVLEKVLGVPAAQQHNAHGMRLANAMRHSGWERPASDKVIINGQRVRGYTRPRKS